MKFSCEFALGVVATLALIAATLGGFQAYDWWQERALATQDKQAIEAFRAKYSLTEDAAVSGQRMTGINVYSFNLEGKHIILLGNTWIEVTSK